MRRLARSLLLVMFVAWAVLPSARAEFINGDLILAGHMNYCEALGSGNVYACSLTPALTQYRTGGCYFVRVGTANTGAASLNLNGIGSRPLRKVVDGVFFDLVANELAVGQILHACYDGSIMQVQTPLLTASSTGGGGGGGGGVGVSEGFCPLGQFVTGVTSDGHIECSFPDAPSAAAHFIVTQADNSLPNAMNLAILPPGLLLTTVPEPGVATVQTTPLPAGDLVGTTASQILTNKEYVARSVPLDNASPTLQINLSDTDIAVASDLQQAVFFVNPIGNSSEGRWLRLRLKSTVPQPLTWDEKWSGESGIPLPTHTTGGTTYDGLLFQWSGTSGKLVLIHNTQLLAPLGPTGVTAGTYTCPASLSVDTLGRLTQVASGPCGGIGGEGSGLAGDVQLMGPTGSLIADSGFFRHNRGTHQTSTQTLLSGQGISYLSLTDASGRRGTLVAPALTTNRVWTLPDTSGQLAVGAGPAAQSRGLVFQLGDEQGPALLTTAVATVTIPFSCTIASYAITTDAADTTFRVKWWRVADGGTAKPAVGNAISTAGLGVPTGTHVKSSTVADFTSTAIAAYDTVTMNLSTANTVKYISATLECVQ